MATNLQTDPGSGMGELVSGIIQDAQELISQQLSLFKQEVRQDLSKAREAFGLLTLGAGILLIGSLLLSLMLVQLLAWLVPTLPLWVCYAIIGGLMTATGACLAWQGREKLGAVNPIPEKTAQALEENLEWKTKPS